MHGVEVVQLRPHDDDRGRLTEVFRSAWVPEFRPVQWNAVRSVAGTLRGVHCHIDHADYLTMVDGSMLLALHDLRPGSSTEGSSETMELVAGETAVVVPPGVAHGFYFGEPALMLYAVTQEWDTSDELGCRFDDPGLRIAWPCADPLLSARDQVAGSLPELRSAVRAVFGERRS